MRILLLSKPRAVTRLVEETAEDLRLAGHAALVIPYRNIRIKQPIERFLLSPASGALLSRWIVRRMRWFKPDLIVAFGPLRWLPPPLFQHLAHLPDRPPLVAWIGDLFTQDDAAIASLFDLIAYTDSGLIDLHTQFGWQPPAAFVPLAASRRVLASPISARIPRLAFVATPTPDRLALLAQVKEPVNLFGQGWSRGGLSHHPIDPRRVRARKLAEIYRSHLGALNVRHEINVINGLNQRHFAPYIYGTPVITDAQPDVTRCFDPEADILVYRDTTDLDALCRELRKDPARAAAIGAAGQRRVLAQHTYTHRMETIATLLGITPARART